MEKNVAAMFGRLDRIAVIPFNRLAAASRPGLGPLALYPPQAAPGAGIGGATSSCGVVATIFARAGSLILGP